MMMMWGPKKGEQKKTATLSLTKYNQSSARYSHYYTLCFTFSELRVHSSYIPVHSSSIYFPSL